MARVADTARGVAGEIIVDGACVSFHPGETIAAAMLAAGHAAFRRDRHDRPRGLWCNMGTCCECLVLLERDGEPRRVRACLVDAAPGQRVTTRDGAA
ncbi:2Fe-2S iron-sulfur cluster-binding protein [Sphingomonas sp. BK580]|uniref:2Fe-2S iron-sulfur cluster-binding protein n=1 Tax=Sphingomonas sp. BK580 TaxID=2586972 RepID=UPI00161187CA|nr:2Fe-2S iron-sulfur cluster-binding protein [Sphingomonas sp. BK580]